MESLDLSDELLTKLDDYMAARKLSYRTRKEYMYTLKRIQKAHKFIDADVARRF